MWSTRELTICLVIQTADGVYLTILIYINLYHDDTKDDD